MLASFLCLPSSTLTARAVQYLPCLRLRKEKVDSLGVIIIMS